MVYIRQYYFTIFAFRCQALFQNRNVDYSDFLCFLSVFYLCFASWKSRFPTCPSYRFPDSLGKPYPACKKYPFSNLFFGLLLSVMAIQSRRNATVSCKDFVRLPIWNLLLACPKVQRNLCLLQVPPHCRKDYF